MIKSPALSGEMIEKLNKIKMLVLDVDGILTDATVHMNSNGEWCRHYNVRDGWALVRLKESGYKLAVITGAKARDVRERTQYLGVDYLYEGQKEKEEAFSDLLKKAGLQADEVAYMGDDVPDVPLLKKAGIGATVPDALPQAIDAAIWVTQRMGGQGAVREISDLIFEFGALTKR